MRFVQSFEFGEAKMWHEKDQGLCLEDVEALSEPGQASGEVSVELASDRASVLGSLALCGNLALFRAPP